jgi:hypothetical protein
MAADTMCVFGYTKLNQPKIAKKNGYLFGAAGENCPNLSALADWFLTNLAYLPKKRLPHYGKDTAANFTMMVVTPKGKILMIDHDGNLDEINYRYWAIGSGDHVALGAMGMGGTAVQAVKLAIVHADGVGGRVTTKTLK